MKAKNEWSFPGNSKTKHVNFWRKRSHIFPFTFYFMDWTCGVKTAAALQIKGLYKQYITTKLHFRKKKIKIIRFFWISFGQVIWFWWNKCPCFLYSIANSNCWKSSLPFKKNYLEVKKITEIDFLVENLESKIRILNGKIKLKKLGEWNTK